MSTEMKREAEREVILSAVQRLRSGILALTFGLLGGTGLFLATIWLVIRGGRVVGPNLGLLANYFPGYTVTVGGAFLGFVYGAITGGIIGWALGFVYNRIVDWRDRRLVR